MTTEETLSVPKPEERVEEFERMAFGAFFNLCLAAQLGKAEWHMLDVPLADYDLLRDHFTAAEFDPEGLANLLKEAGIKYLGIVARHHEGFSFFDTRGLSDFDVMHSPARRDIVAETAEACRAHGIAVFMGVVIWDWHFYLSQGYDVRTTYRSHGNVDRAKFDEYLDYLHASVEILCKHYGPVGGFWFDGTWSRVGDDWKEDRLYALIRRYHPNAIIINNSGIRQRGGLGHPEVDCVTFEDALATPLDRRGHAKYVAAETCQTINRHWGHADKDWAYKSPGQIIENLALCRKAGANYLTNIPATPAAGIPQLEAAVLRKVGQWVHTYADAVYNGKPVPVKCSGRDFVLETGGRWYYFAFDLPMAGEALADLAGPRTVWEVRRHVRQVCWSDNGEELRFAQNLEGGFVTIDLPPFPGGMNLVVRVAEMAF